MNSRDTSLLLSAAGVGVAIGLALPSIVQRLRRSLPRRSSASESTSNSTDAVRSGLDDPASIRIGRADLDGFLGRILQAVGCSPADAALVANVLTYADARGIPSHGSNRCDTYANEISAGLVDVTARPKIASRSGCCAVVDGGNGLGAVTSRLAMETALERAEEHGVAGVACRASNHYGAAGYWADRALKAGCIGMSFTNTSPFAVPTGGKTRAVGTNPFCFFAPAAGEDSFQLDMATTTVPIGKIEVMNRLGKEVPGGWGVDRDGNDCTDAAEICRFGGLYPLGGGEETAGYKGYGLGAFVEIMCSLLSGAAVGPEVSTWSVTRSGPLNYGHAFVVIDPARFKEGFGERLGQYLTRMRGQDGDVKVAGDPEKQFERDAAERGIILHAPVAASLKSLASKYNVEVPEALQSLDESKSRQSLYS